MGLAVAVRSIIAPPPELPGGYEERQVHRQPERVERAVGDWERDEAC